MSLPGPRGAKHALLHPVWWYRSQAGGSRTHSPKAVGGVCIHGTGPGVLALIFGTGPGVLALMFGTGPGFLALM